MNRDEVLALGVPEERLMEFQDKYNRDLQRMAKRKIDGSEKGIRSAIESMLPLIHSTTALREILRLVTSIYCARSSYIKKDDE